MSNKAEVAQMIRKVLRFRLALIVALCLAASVASMALLPLLQVGSIAAESPCTAPGVTVVSDAAGDQLAHVHIQDSDGYADRHWAPGEGTIRWRAIFRALGRLNSNPRLIIELRDHAMVLAGAAHLAELGLAE